MSCPFSSRDRQQLIAKLGRPFFHVFDQLLLVLLLIFVHAQWVVLNLVFQHPIYHPGNGMGYGHGSLGRSQQSGTQTAVEYSPKAHSACFTDCATIRKACPARFFVLRVLLFNTLPPDILCFGANPNQEQKCLSVGNLLMSVTYSRITVCTSETPMPSTRLMSTRLMRFRWPRIFSLS